MRNKEYLKQYNLYNEHKKMWDAIWDLYTGGNEKLQKKVANSIKTR